MNEPREDGVESPDHRLATGYGGGGGRVEGSKGTDKVPEHSRKA